MAVNTKKNLFSLAPLFGVDFSPSMLSNVMRSGIRIAIVNNVKTK